MSTVLPLQNGQILNLDIGFASFLPVLIKIVSLTSGPIIELGTGIYSTPFLHWACLTHKRELISYENNQEFFKIFQAYQEGFHKVFFVEDFKTIIPDKHFDIIFIDHFPQEDRGAQLEKLVRAANFVIVHDVIPEDFVGVSKYRFDHPATPGTSLFSNFVDINNLEI